MSTTADDSRFVYEPTDSVKEGARLADFIRRAGCGDLPGLLAQAAARPDWFWDEVVRYFEIPFVRPYDVVRDVTAGMPWTRWFVGGTTNVALACLDKPLAAGDADKAIITWQGEDGSERVWTYRMLADEAGRLANALVRLGVGPGDPVAVFMPPLPEVAAAFFAVARLGAVVVPLFSGLSAGALQARLRDVQARAAITVATTRRRGQTVALKPVLDQAMDAVPSIHSVVVLDATKAAAPMKAGRDHDWRAWTAAEPSSAQTVVVPSEHPVMIMYTSGTSGLPKGTVHTHAGLMAKVAVDNGLVLDMRPGDRMIWPTDPGWLGGTTRIVAGTLLGVQAIMMEGVPDYPKPDRLWSLVQRHAVTLLGASPTLIRNLMRLGAEPRGIDLSSLRYCALTGEPADRNSWLWLFEHGCGRSRPVLNISGGTEIGGSILGTSLLDRLKPSCLGFSIPGMDADIVDADGTPTPIGEMGELVLRQHSPGLTRGLLRDPDRYLETYWSRFGGLWNHGDLVSRDSDGLWYVHGRSDDVIKVSGKRIAAAEIEGILIATGQLADAAVVGIPHDVKGYDLACVCVPLAGVAATDDLAGLLTASVVEKAGKSFRPARILFVSELPKTKTMKTVKRLLRAALVGDDLGDLSSLHNPQAVSELVAGIAAGRRY